MNLTLAVVVFMCAEKRKRKRRIWSMLGKKGQLVMPILQMELEVRICTFQLHVALINTPFHVAFLLASQ
jgi:hypothetical protein